jgi:hypothetical protein
MVTDESTLPIRWRKKILARATLAPGRGAFRVVRPPRTHHFFFDPLDFASPAAGAGLEAPDSPLPADDSDLLGAEDSLELVPASDLAGLELLEESLFAAFL